MVEITLPNGLETSISRRFWVFPFWIIFSLLNFFGLCVFLVHPTVASVLLFASVEKFNVSCMRDFFRMIYFIRIRTRGGIYGQIYPSAGRSSRGQSPRELLKAIVSYIGLRNMSWRVFISSDQFKSYSVFLDQANSLFPQDINLFLEDSAFCT